VTRSPGGTTAEQILTRLDAGHRLVVQQGAAEPAPAGWDADPTPLAPRRLLPPFPVDAFPPWVADQVIAVAEFTQTPLDLPGCIALAALSTAAGGRAVLEVRPGWREPLNLFTVVAMPPGSRKSAVFAAMTGPLLDAERALIEQARPAIIQAELARKVHQRDAERHTTAAGDASTPQVRDQALADAADAALDAQDTRVPVLPRLVADDVTPEAAASLLAGQGGRLAVLSAEGGVFATMAGRYSGGVPSLEVFLKGHAGDLLRVDRKARPAEHVTAPALTLGLALQPDVLRDIARLPGFRGRGLLARILYSLPENTVGRRRVGAAAVPASVSHAYHHQLRAAVLTLAGDTDPITLRLSTEANERVLDLERRIEPRLAPDADLGHITDWASKLVGATTRMTGLLHLAGTLRTDWTGPIPANHVDAAARLGHYFLAHALAVFDTMSADPTIDDARAVLHWIGRTNQTAFSRRDAFSALSRSRFRKVADLDPALTLLDDHGFIRTRPRPAATGGRPASPTWEVHPRAAEAAEAADRGPR